MPLGFTGLSFLLAAAALRHGLGLAGNGLSPSGLPALGLGLFLLSVTACSMADARCRIREYIRLTHLLRAYGFRPRQLQRMSRSRCQRDAILQAAREAGLHAEAKTFFSALGYRWYHILPDVVALNPWAFFSLPFLKSTFKPCKPPPSKLGQS